MTIRSTGQHVLTELIKTPLFDDDGPVGAIAQSVLVRPRPPKA